MFRIICTLVIFVAFPGNSPSQDAVALSPTCEFSEIYRKEGWIIPGRDGANKKWRVPTPNKPGIHMTELVPTQRGSAIQSFECSREHAGRLEIGEIHMAIESLRAFDVGERTFAYKLSYAVDGVGASWLVTFYDLDGSGRFTLRRSERSTFVPELIPDWVKNSSDTQARQNGSPVISRK